MRVEIRTEVCGTPTFHVGQFVDMEEKQARAWIDHGYAVAAPIVESTTKEGRK